MEKSENNIKKETLKNNIENTTLNVNATSTKRIWAFTIDIFFANFLRMLLLQTLVFTEQHRVNFKSFMVNFENLFGKNVNFLNPKDYHIRYFVESDICSYVINGLIIFCFAGVIYNFLCYLFFNATIGQKLLSQKLVNFKDEKNANIFKKFVKAIFVPLPFISVFILCLFTPLNYLIHFHVYAPQNSFAIVLISKIIYISNPFSAILAAVFFGLFWYGFYLLNDKRLILSDVLSRTRVEDVKKKRNIELILSNGNNDKNTKDFVYIMDKTLNCLEKFNNYLKSVLNKWLVYLKGKIKK